MVSIAMDTIGQRLKYVRNMLGMTQSDFSNIIGMERSQIARAERDQRELRFDHLTRIAKECNVNLNWLISGEGSVLENQKGQSKKEINDLKNVADVANEWSKSKKKKESISEKAPIVIDNQSNDLPCSVEVLLKVVLAVETVCQEDDIVLNPQAKTTAIALIYQRWLEQDLDKNEIAMSLRLLA